MHLCQAQASKLFRANSDSLCHRAHDFSWNRFMANACERYMLKGPLYSAPVALRVPSQVVSAAASGDIKRELACLFSFRAGIRQRSLNEEGSIRIPVSRYRSLRWFSPQMSTFLLSISVGISVAKQRKVSKKCLCRVRRRLINFCSVR